MTNEEKENDPAYLRGRIDALEDVVSDLVHLLPNRALGLVASSLKFQRSGVETRRDKDENHIDWDRWDRSYNRPDRMPAVTLHAAGYEATVNPILDLVAEVQTERAAGDSIALIAASREAEAADISEANWRRDAEESGDKI